MDGNTLPEVPDSKSPEQRQQAVHRLWQAIDELRQEARENGLTDEIVDAELEAWAAERRT